MNPERMYLEAQRDLVKSLEGADLEWHKVSPKDVKKFENNLKKAVEMRSQGK